MHSQIAIELKENPYSLENIPADWSFWKNLSIKQIHEMLLRPLIIKDSQTQLPKHHNLQALLSLALKRINEFNTPEMKEDCAALAKEFYARNFGALRGYEKTLGFLQLSAMVNFYLGNYRAAAKLAGVLGDVYFLDRHVQTDAWTTHFNLIAGMAYEHYGHTPKASHHYNQYLEYTAEGIQTPEAVYAVTTYLLNHNLLIVTDNTETLLSVMAAKAISECNDSQLADQLTELLERVLLRPRSIARLTLDITGAQNNLEEVANALFSVEKAESSIATHAKTSLFAARSQASPVTEDVQLRKDPSVARKG